MDDSGGQETSQKGGARAFLMHGNDYKGSQVENVDVSGASKTLSGHTQFGSSDLSNMTYFASLAKDEF